MNILKSMKAAPQVRVVHQDDLLSVYYPARAALPKAFISQCHYLAGETGSCIRFVAVFP